MSIISIIMPSYHEHHQHHNAKLSRVSSASSCQVMTSIITIIMTSYHEHHQHREYQHHLIVFVLTFVKTNASWQVGEDYIRSWSLNKKKEGASLNLLSDLNNKNNAIFSTKKYGDGAKPPTFSLIFPSWTLASRCTDSLKWQCHEIWRF